MRRKIVRAKKNVCMSGAQAIRRLGYHLTRYINIFSESVMQRRVLHMEESRCSASNSKQTVVEKMNARNFVCAGKRFKTREDSI